MHLKIIFPILQQNHLLWYSKELSQWDRGFSTQNMIVFIWWIREYWKFYAHTIWLIWTYEIYIAWVKDFRIIPEFRILRLQKVSLKMLNKADFNSFSDIFSVHLRAIDHLNSNLLILCWYTVSYKIWFSKVQDFWNFELSPMTFIVIMPNLRYNKMVANVINEPALEIFYIYCISQHWRFR